MGYTTITVDAAGGGDYLGIMEAVRATPAGSVSDRKIIFIKNGTYNETEVNNTGKPFFEFKGESKAGVIVRVDGSATTVTGTDYAFPAYASTQLNLIPEAFKHGFWLEEDTIIRDLTIHISDAKYCIHLDENVNISSRTWVENVDLITTVSATACLGIGQYKDQKMAFNDVLCTTNGVGYGLLWHNATNGTNGVDLEVTNMTITDGPRGFSLNDISNVSLVDKVFASNITFTNCTNDVYIINGDQLELYVRDSGEANNVVNLTKTIHSSYVSKAIKYYK